MSVFINLLLISFFMGQSVMASENLHIVRFDLTESVKKYLKSHQLDVTGVNYKTMEIEAHLNQKELNSILAQKTKIRFSYPQHLSFSPDDEYKNPEEIENLIRDTHAKYPNITQVVSMGKTLEGREILAIKISDNAKKDEKEPVLLVNAMHHAREVMTPEITTDMVEYLTTNYEKNAEVTNWIKNTEIWIVPMLNLDGNSKMWAEDSMWRKNTRGGFGVDLNRNYPTGWDSCRGSSGYQGAQNYRGEFPASEPETQAMMNLVSKIKPVFNISYHSYSEIVIYPFGCRPKKTPTEEAVESIGVELGAKLNYKPGTAWELLYNADGGDIDWMYTEHQVIPYVIEVNSTSEGFHPSYAKWRDRTVLKNREGWKHLLNKLQGPSLQGQVPVGKFKFIKIYKAGDKKLAQTYKINPDGTYFIILKAGKYDISFEGSEVKSFSSVNIDKKISLR